MALTPQRGRGCPHERTGAKITRVRPIIPRLLSPRRSAFDPQGGELLEDPRLPSSSRSLPGLSHLFQQIARVDCSVIRYRQWPIDEHPWDEGSLIREWNRLGVHGEPRGGPDMTQGSRAAAGETGSGSKGSWIAFKVLTGIFAAASA